MKRQVRWSRQAAKTAVPPEEVAGAGIWAASYFGWVPAFGILAAAHRHPLRRTALMLLGHVVWGAAAGAALRELVSARATMLRTGPLLDR